MPLRKSADLCKACQGFGLQRTTAKAVFQESLLCPTRNQKLSFSYGIATCRMMTIANADPRRGCCNNADQQNFSGCACACMHVIARLGGPSRCTPVHDICCKSAAALYSVAYHADTSMPSISAMPICSATDTPKAVDQVARAACTAGRSPQVTEGSSHA